MKKKQLILVDHNEKTQAVDNIDSAEILEIIDHHRLVLWRPFSQLCSGTSGRMYRNDPLSDVCGKISGDQSADRRSALRGYYFPTLLCSGRLPVLLPIRWRAGALALIAGINIEEFAKEMFTAGSNLKGKTIEVIFYQDFKRFTSDKVNFGVGQISSMSAQELTDLKKRILPVMKHECGKNGVSMVFFMLTNILEESSEILCYGDGSGRLVEESFEVKEKDGGYLLPGVVSRKKQLIPAFIGTLQQNNS